MSEGTLVKPQEGVSKMKEVSGTTGQVGGGKEPLKGGLYRHPVSGEEIIALDDPITGDAQARGYVRAGFEWVRDVEADEIKTVGLVSSEFAAQPERKLESDEDMLKGLRARLNMLEANEAKRKEETKPVTATELSQKLAQEAAEQKTAERGNDNVAPADVNGVTTPLNESTEVDTEEATDEEDAKTTDENDPSIGELRNKARELGLPTGGTKEVLKTRIAEKEAN